MNKIITKKLAKLSVAGSPSKEEKSKILLSSLLDTDFWGTLVRKPVM